MLEINENFLIAVACATDGSNREMKGENNVSMPALRVNSRRFHLRIMILQLSLGSQRS